MSESSTGWATGISRHKFALGKFDAKERHAAYPHEPWCRFCGMGLGDSTSLKMICQPCRMEEGVDRLQTLMVVASSAIPSNHIIVNTVA